jgi:eukaryotic-like serine/threonine-protein kinase
VPVLDGAIDPDTGTPFLVMPMMRGEDLESLLARSAPLAPEVAVRIAIQAARGLRVAHEFGVVHRDVKPSNIFLDATPAAAAERAPGADGPPGRGAGEAGEAVTARVCDFGIAKIKPVDERHITRTGAVLGSPIYMSPEQLVNARAVDPRADVWSLGMTLYHALAGAPPLASISGFTELVLTLTSKDIPSLQEAAPWIDPGLARVVHGTLLRDVEARCPSMDALIAALLPYAGDSEALREPMLRQLAPERRRALSPASPLPSHWESPDSVAQASTERTPDPLLGRRVGGQYVLVHRLGEGPFGAVYEAEVDGGGRCALKVIRAEVFRDDAPGQQAFVADVLETRKIKSDNVIKVLDAGVDDELGGPFVAMELLTGIDLSQAVKQAGPLEPSAASRIFVQACRGLSAAHAAGIVHGDIRPTNIFLSEQPGGRVSTKICDFGVAKAIRRPVSDGAPALPRVGKLTMSPMYLAPEACTGDAPLSHRSDIWSLCVTLYEALSGKKPWHGFTSVGEMFLTMTAEDIRALREVAPWVEAGLAEAVHGGLERDPLRRYASLGDLAFKLGPFASGTPSLTRASLSGVPMARRSLIVRTPDGGPVTGDTGVADTVSAPDLAAAIASGAARNSRSQPPRGSLPSIGRSTALSSGTPSGAPSAHPPSRIAPWAPIVGALVVVAGAAAFWAARPSSAPRTAASTQPPPAQSAAPRRFRSVVSISPPDAAVSVNGVPRALEPGGNLTLEGEAGEPFKVLLQHGSYHKIETVYITRDGSAHPSAFVVPAGSAAHLGCSDESIGRCVGEQLMASGVQGQHVRRQGRRRQRLRRHQRPVPALDHRR